MNLLFYSLLINHIILSFSLKQITSIFRSKVASWLKQSGHRPLLAACDTFRAGAVEQLKVHSRRLRIDLYEKGYGKDDTGVAQDAIRYGMILIIMYFFCFAMFISLLPACLSVFVSVFICLCACVCE